MVLNKDHRDFLEFRAKWDALVTQYQRDMIAAEAEFPDWRGMDHPKTGKIATRFHQEITALQREYRHLYGPESEQQDEYKNLQ